MDKSPVALCPWGFLDFSATSSKLNTATGQLSGQLPKARTFAAIVTNGVETSVNLSQLPSPTVRGDVTYVKISEDLYQEQLRSCRTNLIGRLLLKKGTMPMKTELLKSALASLWKLHNSWKLVPLGKGYFDLHFSSEEDMRRVWGGGTCTLQFGLFRLSQWQPDFKPGDVLPQTHAQVWIKIYGLSQEYWHPRILMEIARGVGTPLQLDHATREKLYGYYARILVDVDLSADLPSTIMVEREQHGFSVDIIYENLPPTCGHCGVIGHNTNKCRHLKGNHSDGMHPHVEAHRRGRSPTRQVYRPKPSAKTVSPPGDTIHMERSPSVEILHNNRSTGLNNDMGAPLCSSLEQRHTEQVNDFANQILMTVVNNELSVLADKVIDSSTDPHGHLETISDRQLLKVQPTNIINDSPSCNLNDTLSEEMRDEPSEEINIDHNVDVDVPPGFGLRKEINVVDAGKDSNDFTLVLSKSQQKKQKKNQKVDACRQEEPYVTRAGRQVISTSK
ncbi:uncharacterized protein [Malus domestica]|uniref:uncharacterized protein n=1 Tax=Malus domestica TaxID=3750 RepID=UPI0010AA4BAE|nr:uncharacterized protein LOC103413411 [Malus domestica]